MSNQIKVAFVGLGWVSREVWLPIFSSLPDVCVTGIYDVAEEAIKLTQKKHPSVPVYTNVNAIINAKPDLVLIATPNKFHIEYAELFLKNNISILIEKPICLNLAEYHRLNNLVKNSSAICFPSSASKFREDIFYLTNLLSNGEYGPINSLQLEWVRSSGIPKPGSWFTEKSLAGGGVGYDLGWHVLDVGYSLLDYPEVASAIGIASSNFINAESSTEATWRNDSSLTEKLAISVEDQFTGFIKTVNNVGISLKVAWASHEKVDATRIIVNCKNATFELLTTFGFSPNRISDPHLKIKQRGCEKIIKFDNLIKGAEYKKYVENVLAEFKNRELTKNYLREVFPIIKSLELIYSSFSNN